mmetsp:Transcript_152694/g.281381  ORF Transcript_152694/g.281381 Transcript_152694/m.281381 type:complete len:812 (+) Transcript_152694:270-2705(+)
MVQPHRYADDGFSRQVGDILEERIARLKPYSEGGESCTRNEIAEFLHKSIKTIRKEINPERGAKYQKAWLEAKGMLKDIIDWDTFNAGIFRDEMIKFVDEKTIVSTLERYRIFVLTGEVKTKYPPPKLLGETEQILCVEKPVNYICGYGDKGKEAPFIQGATSATALLNGDKEHIQIHEYLALKFDFDTALRTREWWKQKETHLTCVCGKCPYCAITQTGCCNRLDKETSGVMIAAKTLEGFPEIRKQFQSEHSIEKGGTEKYYLALVHGHVELPDKDDTRSGFWKHGPEPGGEPGRKRGRIAVSCVWDGKGGKSVPWDSGAGEFRMFMEQGEKAQWAVTFYEPIAWFTDVGEGKFTLTHIQIVTGRRHQIRFHMGQVGYPLVGDERYGAPRTDREWCPRVFLHSYQTKFREPFTLRWFEAMSPLPQDLGEIMEKNLSVLRHKEFPPGLEPGKEEENLLKSRRHHAAFEKFLTQYNPKEPLLVTHDVAVNTAAQIGNSGILIRTDDATPATYLPDGTALNAKGYPIRIGRKPCVSFNTRGFCNLKEHCPFDHSGKLEDGIVLNTKGYPLRPGEQVCAFYAKSGTCNFGKFCLKHHPGDPATQNGNDEPDEFDALIAASEKADFERSKASTPPPQQQQSENWKESWKPSWQPEPAWQPEAEKEADNWESWKTKSWETAADNSEPSSKRRRIVVPPENANWTPRTPPADGYKKPAPPQPSQPLFKVPQQPVAQPQAMAPAMAPQQPLAPQQAGWKRMESRSQAGVFYYWNQATGETSAEPPHPWEIRQSRSQAGVFYYWNAMTNQTSATKPEV